LNHITITNNLNTLYNNNIPDGRYSDSWRCIVQIEYECDVVHSIIIYYDVINHLHVNEYKNNLLYETVKK
jgi:hypothetical protein